MRALATACALCALAAGATASSVRPADAAGQARASTAIGNALIARIDHYRHVTWRWQRTMGLPRTDSARSARQSPDLAYRRWVLRLWKHRAARVRQKAAGWVAVKTDGYRREVVHWRRVMGAVSVPGRRLESAGAGPLRVRHHAMLAWRKRAAAVRKQAQNPPRRGAWLCIHRYEGSWRDAGGPYYGGLQMNLTFQRRYGGYLLRTKGTADHWTPLEQMWVAERAYRSGRGFAPWPSTARACGLL